MFSRTVLSKTTVVPIDFHFMAYKDEKKTYKYVILYSTEYVKHVWNDKMVSKKLQLSFLVKLF